MKNNNVLIQVKNLVKTYHNGEIETKVLKHLDLDIKKGEFIAIMGKSGAGKSTLMYQISLLDIPTSGKIIFDGVDILQLSELERTQFRLKKLGYVFQDYALIPELSAEENITLPMIMQGIDEKIAKKKAGIILKEIGMGDKYSNRPNQLSGGEQQRVSIARAVAHEPAILFADEPTANLDTISSQAVLDLLKQFHKQGQTIVMVTHEPEYTAYCDRVIYLKDGHIIDYDYQINHK